MVIPDAQWPAAVGRFVRLMCGFALLLAGGTAVPCRAQVQDTTLALLLERADRYLNLLSTAGADRSVSAELRRHLTQLALLLPDDLQRQIADGDLLTAPDAVTIRSGAGQKLVHWWRRQDPLPASPVNERLLEHMQRVQYAEDHFASADRPTGFDDRGDVYVRYGRPERQLVIKFDESEFTDKLYRFGMVMQPTDFPANIFWRYGHIDGTGNFLFLEREGEYRIARTTELLPRPLRAGFTPAKRGQRRAEMALAAMRTIYRQLAGEHPVYLERFSDVDNYLSNHEEPGRVAARVLGDAFARVILDQDEDTELQPGASARPLSEITQSTITSSRVHDDQLAYQRDLIMPRTYTEVYRTLPLMKMGIRAARFLDADGTTRTELYWGPTPGALRRSAPEEAYLLHMTTVLMGPGYERRAVKTRSIQVTDLPRGDDAVIPVQQEVLRGNPELLHLALQWDFHRMVEGAEGRHMPGQRIRVAAAHFDSLQALNGSREVLEMSDLKPVMLWSAVELDGTSAPYPYYQVGTDLPLGLFFEIYNLRYDEDDYTRYAVTIRIARFSEGNRRERLQAPTSVLARYTGTSANEAQEVLLDLSDWRNAGAVEVRVTVRDLTAQRSVARTIQFELF